MREDDSRCRNTRSASTETYYIILSCVWLSGQSKVYQTQTPMSPDVLIDKEVDEIDWRGMEGGLKVQTDPRLISRSSLHSHSVLFLLCLLLCPIFLYPCWCWQSTKSHSMIFISLSLSLSHNLCHLVAKTWPRGQGLFMRQNQQISCNIIKFTSEINYRATRSWTLLFLWRDTCWYVYCLKKKKALRGLFV